MPVGHSVVNYASEDRPLGRGAAVRQINPTTRVERLLLMSMIVLVPIEDHVPTIAGRSILFLVFGVLTTYTILNRTRAVGRTWLHPVFLSAYIMLFACFLIESAHSNSRYAELGRFVFMLIGAVVVAALCRDQRALRACMYGYVIGSIWLSALLFFTSYSALNQASATNYDEASRVRSEVSEEIPLEGDLNQLAFLVAQGAIVATALTLTTRSFPRRGLFMGASLVCLIGSFLPMSRGGIVIVIGSCIAVVLKHRAKRLQGFTIALLLFTAVIAWVPDVVFSRLETSKGARRQVYTAAIENLPEYFVTGVGAGNFGIWGARHGFPLSSKGTSIGAHNVHLQVTLYWGLAGLLPLMAIMWHAYRCLPDRYVNDSLALCLPGLAVSLVLMMLFSQGFYDKWYSLGLGLLVGTRTWFWPTTQRIPTKEFHSLLAHAS